jgi:hypothetical protein
MLQRATFELGSLKLTDAYRLLSENTLRLESKKNRNREAPGSNAEHS